MLSRLFLVSLTVVSWGRALATDPCATANDYKIDFLSTYPQATRASVPAEIVEECLRTVPINKEEDLALIDEYKLWFDWQSNLAWHKNPPEGFTDGSTDVIGDLDAIRKDLADDKYTSSYELMGDIQAAVVKAHDFHFQVRPWIRNSLFGYKRGDSVEAFAMVSVSKDGKEVPKLYDYHDIIKSDGADWTPSPISRINNQTAEKYAEAYSESYEYHDSDARYNQLFPSQARRATTAESVDYLPFGRNVFPDGAYTTIEHENGTIRNLVNYAILGGTWSNVGSADDLAAILNHTFVSSTADQSSTTKTRRAVESASASPTPTGYPESLGWGDLGGGFFLTGKGYEDVAVLALTTFEVGNDWVAWQDLVGLFLQEAKNAGKTKLVIDVRGNGGGTINLGYDLFQQLFPSLYPYGATTLHAHDALDLAGQSATKALSNYTYDVALNAPNSDVGRVWGSWLNYEVPMTIDGKPFSSWEEYFGPTLHDGSNTTTPQRRNMTNAFADQAAGKGGLDITGYGNRVDKLNKTQFFEPNDMVLLSDGTCGSTCSVFAELMKSQGHVQQIAIGGLPKTGPMQAVGGTKGGQVYAITELRDTLALIVDNDPSLNQTVVGEMLKAKRPFERDASGGASTRVNFRDNIRINDTSVTPLEFVYEAADCRLFYTAEMIRNVTAVWQKTVDAHWGDANKTCVEGSVGHKSSLSGGVFNTTQSSNTASGNTPPSSGSASPTESRKGAAVQMHARSSVMLMVLLLFVGLWVLV